MYYNLNTNSYTTEKPDGNRGRHWVDCYEKTGKPLMLEDLKPFPNLYKTFSNISVDFYYNIYLVASRFMADGYMEVFQKNFDRDLDFPILGVYIETYEEFLEFLQLSSSPRWPPNSFDSHFNPKYMGYDRTLVWDHFRDTGDAKNYFINNLYSFQDYKNQFLNQKQSTDGTDFKVKRPIAQITRGAEIRGNSVQGRKCSVTVTVRPLSNQEVIIS